jgi:hypothetical protein
MKPSGYQVLWDWSHNGLFSSKRYHNNILKNTQGSGAPGAKEK